MDGKTITKYLDQFSDQDRPYVIRIFREAYLGVSRPRAVIDPNDEGPPAGLNHMKDRVRDALTVSMKVRTIELEYMRDGTAVRQRIALIRKMLDTLDASTDLCKSIRDQIEGGSN